ncbi:MAG: TraR/DksA C4-type zinc finger protein [Nitrospiraceae bacterium]|nr:TraR/DksA C4-type zinc finger protein [Nitrospiraceae bacterium]
MPIKQTKKTTKRSSAAHTASASKSATKKTKAAVIKKASASKNNSKKPASAVSSKKSTPRTAPKSSAAKKAPVKTAVKKQASADRAVLSKQDRNERLRRILISKREELLKESQSEIRKYISGEKRQLVETVMDDGDLSVVDLSEDINLKKLSTHKDMLTKIDIALRKIDEGTYGICEECGEEISEERLKVLPFAIYCRDDQEKKEMLERLEREIE